MLLAFAVNSRYSWIKRYSALLIRGCGIHQLIWCLSLTVVHKSGPGTGLELPADESEVAGR